LHHYNDIGADERLLWIVRPRIAVDPFCRSSVTASPQTDRRNAKSNTANGSSSDAIGGLCSEKNRSAGEFAPSSTSWLASSGFPHCA
jgi:hypothetical protein